MHFKRKQKNGGIKVVLIFLLVLLVAALGGGVWLLRDDITALWQKAPEPVALPPSAPVLAFSPWDGAGGFVSQDEEEAQMAYLDQFVSFAVQHDFKGVLVHLLSGNEQDALIFGRDRAYETIENVLINDTLFHRFDPMAYLNESARAQGLTVLAAVPQAPADSNAQKVALRAMKKYGLANVYESSPGMQTQGFAGVRTLTGMISVVDQSVLGRTSDDTWLHPADVVCALNNESLPGIVIEDYVTAQQNTDALTRMVTAFDTAVAAPTPLGFTPSTALTVTYPAVDAKIYTAQCFIMGTSDPTQPLTLNGTEVVRNGTTGAFGVLVDVAQGDNVFTFAQGATQVEHKIVRPAPSGGTGGATQRDATQSVPKNSYVAVSNWIASLLYDPSGDNKISETVRQGGIARVVDCVETKRNGKITWAYQLESGDFILAYNTNFLGTDVPRASFTGATAQVVSPREESLTFTGTGTPMAYANLEGNDLALHFYDTDLAPDFAVTGSSFVRSAVTSTLEGGGVELRLQFAQPLHGFSVEYANGTLQLLLRNAPVRSTEVFSKPLAGVSVLLDPGHGLDDTGAMGVAGKDAPQEKDVNLAVAMAAKYRLEQMGATVHSIRTDDSFLTLIERNQKITELKPDFFISIHHNSVELTVDANAAAGTECYYFYDQGKPLAETLVKNVVDVTGRVSREAKWGYYYVARNTLCPAVLLECGFMVNPSEYENVTNDKIILSEGDAIAAAVLSQVKSAS